MESTTESVVREADERVERAKDSLSDRIDELSRRFRGAKNMVDIEAQIADHPWPAIGIALALGAFAGLAGGRRDDAEPAPERSMSGAVLAGVGAVAFRLIKSYAFSKLTDAAKGWVDGRAGTAEAGTAEAGTTEAGTTEAGTAEAGTTEAGTTEAGTTEQAASRDPSVEAFLKH